MHFPEVLRHALLAAPLFLVACGGGGGGSATAELTTGEFSVGVTDAPVDSAQRVLVQFAGVAVKPADADDLVFELEGDTQTCQDLLDGVAPYPTPAGEATVRCIDLLQLQGTQSATLLDGVVLAAGQYNWLRLDVDADKGVMDSVIVLDDGREESLYVPSGSQSGLKLNTRFTILAGGRHDFVVDFDLRKSLNDPQGFPDYQLKPALRLIDLAESGSISGTVAASLLTTANCTDDAYAVYVYQGGAGTVAGEDGSAHPPLSSASVTLAQNVWRYTAGFLPPGEYTLAFTCEAANDTAAADDGIALIGTPDSPATVQADRDTEVNFYP